MWKKNFCDFKKDNLIDIINNIIDTYNSIPTVESIDYTVGGTRLAPSGYTLTVGGLKHALRAVKGLVIGAKCCRIDDENIKVTEGLIFTENGTIRLPDRVVPYNYASPVIYYNRTTDEYQLTDIAEEGDEIYKISDLNMNRPSKLVSDRFSIQCENFDGKYDILVKDRTFGGGGTIRRDAYYPADQSKPVFFSPIDGERFEREGTGSVRFDNDTIAWNSQPGHRNLNYWTPATVFFIPKGINVRRIFKVDGDASKTYDSVITKRVDW